MLPEKTGPGRRTVVNWSCHPEGSRIRIPVVETAGTESQTETGTGTGTDYYRKKTGSGPGPLHRPSQGQIHFLDPWLD